MELTFVQFLSILVSQTVVLSLVLGKWLESKGWKVYYYLVQVWKTKRGIKLIDAVAKAWPRFWKAYGNFGIILGFGFIGGLYVFRKRPLWQRIPLSLVSSAFLLTPFMGPATANYGIPRWVFAGVTYFFGFSASVGILVLWSGAYTILGLISGQKVQALAGPAIPGVNIKGSPIQGIPWYVWLVFPILLFVHEFSHGFLARVSRIRLKSVGVVMMGLFPMGAFVEPDDKQIERKRPEETIPLFAAGSTANYLTAFIGFMVFSFAIPVMFQQLGVSQALESYITQPMVVSSMNPDIPVGVEITRINQFEIKSIQDIKNATKVLGPNATVTVYTDKGIFKTRLNSQGKLGVYLVSSLRPGSPWYVLLLVHGLTFIYYLAFFNFVIGIMNLMPMLPLDGGLMVREFLWKVLGFGKDASQKVSLFISILMLLGLVGAMIPVLIQF